MSDRLLIGPYRHLTLEDGTDVPFYIIPFDKRGICQGPETLQRLLTDVKNDDFSDIYLFSHGWNNDWQVAIANYERFLKGFAGQRQQRNLAMPDSYRPLLIGVFWPSTALVFGEDEAGPEIAAADPQRADEAIAQERNEIHELAADLSDEQARRFYALTQKETLTREEALELATIALSIYHADDDELDISEPLAANEILESWLDAMGTLNDDGDFDDLSGLGNIDGGIGGGIGGGVGGPAAAGLGDILEKLNPRQVVRMLTVYKMKDRAGTVGTFGVGPMLNDLLKLGNANVHLIGHSYGCKVVLSAICQPSALARPVHSMLLLQPAVNHLCFAETVPGTDSPGGYRKALDRVKLPILSTFSQRDVALHDTFHFALRRKVDLGEVRIAGGGEPPSRFAALGGYGPRRAGEKLITMPDVGEPYALDASVKIYGLDGTRLIAGHGDISNPATWWALYKQVTAA